MNERISSSSLARLTRQDMTERREALSEIRDQIGTGKRINRPSDDPARAARLIDIGANLSRLEQFDRNADSAELSLQMQETVLDSVIDAVQRIRELTVQASNASNGPAERRIIGIEIDSRLSGLFDLANTPGSDGHALFAGSRLVDQPFTPGSPTGYTGDDTARRVNIGLDRQVATTTPGSELFMRLRDGNGRFRVEALPTNTGTATLNAGSVTDESAFDGTRARIEFSAPDRYDITDANSGALLAADVAYEPGAAVTVAGMTSQIDGEPRAGDAFVLEPARQSDIFTTIEALVSTLNASSDTPANDALRRQEMGTKLEELDTILEHVALHRSATGSRMQSIDASRNETDAVTLQLQTTAASIEDADMADVITRLQEENTALELLQRSYARFTSTSILDYL